MLEEGNVVLDIELNNRLSSHIRSHVRRKAAHSFQNLFERLVFPCKDEEGGDKPIIERCESLRKSRHAVLSVCDISVPESAR